MKSMLKIVEQDGDSFGKKAEIYFKKRPELVNFVEETYKAYRALADRYDHISSELHKANHTIATAFPDQIQFDMQDEDDDNLPDSIGSIDASQIRKQSTDIPPISLMRKRKDHTALKKSRLGRCASKHSKDRAQEEIDKLQKGILALQTEKEYIKTAYESGVAKYWHIEKQITDMQEDVFFLQDEFNATVVLEDDEARSLMAVTAIKTCEKSILKLEDQQKQSMEEARIESERIMAAKEMIMAHKSTSSQPDEIMESSDENGVLISSDMNPEEELAGLNVEGLDSEYLSDVAKEQVEISSDISVVELAEKINELVTKVISLELMASSQAAQIMSLRSEADILHRQLKSFEEEKTALIEDSNSLRDKLKQAEAVLLRAKDFEQHVQDEGGMVDTKSSLSHNTFDDISVETVHPHYKDQVNTAGLSQEVTTLHDSEAARVHKKEVKEPLEFDQNGKYQFIKSSTKSSLDFGDISERLMSAEHLDQKEYLQNENSPTGSVNKVSEAISDTANKAVEESKGIQGNGSRLAVTDDSFDHSEASFKVKEDPNKSQVGNQEFDNGSWQEFDDFYANKESQPQLEKVSDHLEEGSKLKDKSNKSQATNCQYEFSSWQEFDDVDPNKESKSQLEEIFYHSVAGEDGSLKSQVPNKEAEIGLHQKDETMHQRDDSKKSSDHSEAGSQDVKQEVQAGSSHGEDNILQSNESEPQLEDQEVSLNWLQSLVDGVEGKEKIILAEYTSVLRSYKDAKRRLSEVEKKNDETAMQIRELESANAKKDAEIHSLRQNLRATVSNNNHEPNVHVLERGSLQKPEVLKDLSSKARTRRFASFDVSNRNPLVENEIRLPAMDGRQTTSAIEEKFRRDIDTVLEDNLEFWLRFSTSFHGIQKFQATFEELQAEVKKLKRRKLGEGSSHYNSGKATNPESMAIDKKLRELKTELQVWLEHNMLLQGELDNKFSSINSIQEEISGTLEACLEASLEADVVKFAPYQAAKFQGELLNMQLENNQVAEQLKAGLDNIRGLQVDVEKTLSRLHEKFELPEPGSSSHEPLRHVSTKNRIPLKSFLFNVKPKKKQSIFACVNPALHKHIGHGRPPIVSIILFGSLIQGSLRVH